jgi:putative Mg2+ transporter-C (MgtC) family protein
MFEITKFSIFIRIILAIVIGGLIGYEREKKRKPAGFITHMLVCLGAAVIAVIQILVSQSSMAMVLQNPDLSSVVKIDMGRMTAQVVSGVGFLGAGTIFHTQGSIKGITTAATLWITACIGIAIGMGYFFLSITSAVFIIFIMLIMKKFEVLYIEREKQRVVKISYSGDIHTEIKIKKYLKNNNIKLIGAKYLRETDKNTHTEKETVYTLSLPQHMSTESLVKALKEFDEIFHISIH